MTQIRFTSSSTIQPIINQTSDNRRVELNPWDLQLLLVDQIQKGILFHKPICQENVNNNLIQHLKTTLSHTLNIFYPLAGRLAMTENEDKTTSFYVNCNGEGAQFVHAVIDGVTISDILNPLYIPDDIVYSFFPMNEVLNYEGTSKPLLSVQITELVDGIFIGCTMNHCVVDGTSFWHFFNTWSSISQSFEFVRVYSQPDNLVLDRQLINEIIDIPIPIPFFHDQILGGKFIPPPLQQKMFHFPKQKIAELKAKANSQMGSTKISSLQALMAHLWVSITRSRNLNTEQEVSYKILLGARQRIKPPLSEHYFGNSVMFVTVKSTAGELLKNGLGWAALEMNKTIASQTEVEVIKFLEGWSKFPKLNKLEQAIGSDYALATGSSPRFDVFGNDFGWGRPIAVRSGPGNKFNGKLTVFPGAEQGSIDFEACLSTVILQALAKDAEFVEFITT